MSAKLDSGVCAYRKLMCMSDPNLERFAAELRSYMTKKGVKNEPLGKKVGVTRQTISDWRNAKSTPSVARLARLEDALGVERGELSRYLTAESNEVTPTSQPEDLEDRLDRLEESVTEIRRLLERLDNRQGGDEAST